MYALEKLVNKILLSTSDNTGITFNEQNNMFVTPAYTSLAGNTYFKGIKLSQRISIVTDTGIGYAHTFLNGIRIFAITKSGLVELVSKRYHCYYYSESAIKSEAKELIKSFLLEKIKNENVSVDEIWLNSFIEELINETNRNQIETLRNIHLNRKLLE